MSKQTTLQLLTPTRALSPSLPLSLFLRLSAPHPLTPNIAGIYHPTGSYHHSRRSVSGSSWMGPGRPYQQHHGGPDGSSSSSSIGSSSSAGGVGFSGISGALGQIRTTIPKFRWGLRAYILIGVWTASCMMWFYHAYPDTAEDLTAHIHIPDTITNHASKLTDSIGSTLGRTHKKLTSGLHVASSSSAGAAACRFNVSDHPLPVHHIPELLHYNNTPTSRHRPSHQFHDCSTPRTWNEPILTLVTVTHNPGSHFPETHNNLKAQSLHNFQWLIVDDHSDNPEALSRLRHAADTDPRIHLVKNTGPAGVTSARNFGLSAALAGLPYQSPYIAMLDDDDMFELTTIEKAVWMLESNSNWDLVSYDFVKFGHENRTDIRGLHLGSANFYGVSDVIEGSVLVAQYSDPCGIVSSGERKGSTDTPSFPPCIQTTQGKLCRKHCHVPELSRQGLPLRRPIQEWWRRLGFLDLPRGERTLGWAATRASVLVSKTDGTACQWKWIYRGRTRLYQPSTPWATDTLRPRLPLDFHFFGAGTASTIPPSASRDGAILCMADSLNSARGSRPSTMP